MRNWLLAGALATASPAVADTDPPTLASAVANGTTVTLTFSEDLDTGSVPGHGAFLVMDRIGLQRPLSNGVSIAGKTVTLTLGRAIVHGSAVLLGYGDGERFPSSPLQDAARNQVEPISRLPITNNTPDTTAPTFSSATVNGKALSVTFNEKLDAGSAPAGSTFAVSGGRIGTGTASLRGPTAKVTLDEAVGYGETVTVSYTKPTANPLQDGAGNKIATFTDRTLTNKAPAPPRASPSPPEPEPPAEPDPEPPPEPDSEPECPSRVAPYWHGTGGFAVRPTDGESAIVRMECGGNRYTDREYAGEDGLIVRRVSRSRCMAEDGRPIEGEMTFEGIDGDGWYWVNGDRNV
ncbi:MAG: SwmB domain-containing protein, partial [Acidobacteria bacterium]|nr:SwmB domain-containing protein [Acidobacteriota bacterium]